MAARWVPIIGLLAMLALVPGALGDCGFNHGDSRPSTPPQTEGQFTTLSAPVAPSPITLAVLVLLPVALIGGVLALARTTTAAPVATGHWVATQDRWVWVPDKK